VSKVPLATSDQANPTNVSAPTLTPPSVERSMSVGLPQGRARRQIVWETRFVMFAFLVTGIISAVLVFVQHFYNATSAKEFATIIYHHQVLNMFAGMFAYLSVLAPVPIALFLLSRTGQTPQVLGLGRPQFKRDVLPGLGIFAVAFLIEIALAVPFTSLINHHSSLINTASVNHSPKYYLVEGIFISAITAITEETIVNGYLITRLGQMGWTPRRALILSLILRTSYHVYYGIGFILTIPLGYIVTRSFQKHHKLTRPIVAHFLYDAIIFTVGVLT
jgi:membrane protease YdiL (CAAX protease family)